MDLVLVLLSFCEIYYGHVAYAYLCYEVEIAMIFVRMMHWFIVIDKTFIDFVNIRIPVLFEGDLAHTANSYLKKNDRVHITGQILGDVIQSGANSDQACVQLFKSFHGSFSHQVMVRDLHYIEGSKALPKVMPTVNQNEGVLKHSGKLSV